MAVSIAAPIRLELEDLVEKASLLAALKEDALRAQKRVELPFFEKLRKDKNWHVTVVYEGLDIEPPPSFSLVGLDGLERVTKMAFTLEMGAGTLEVYVEGPSLAESKPERVTLGYRFRLGAVAYLENLLAFIEIVQALREKGIDPIKDLAEKIQRKTWEVGMALAALKRLEALLRVI